MALDQSPHVWLLHPNGQMSFTPAIYLPGACPHHRIFLKVEVYLVSYHSLLAFWAFLVTQLVKNPPEIQETLVQLLDWEDPLEKGKAIHSSILGFPLWFSW